MHHEPADTFIVSATDVWTRERRTVVIEGDVDLATRTEIIAACLAGTEHDVEIDLAQATFMDCAGYTGLLFAQRHLAAVGRHATIVNANGQPAWLLELIDALSSATPAAMRISRPTRELSAA